MGKLKQTTAEVQTLLDKVEPNAAGTSDIKSSNSERLGSVEASKYALKTALITDEQKALLAFLKTENTVTVLSDLPKTGHRIYAAIEANESLSVSTPEIPPLSDIHVFVQNVSDASVTIAIPTTGVYVSSTDSVTLEPSARCEVNIAYDSREELYKIKVQEG